jgi:hypothetical protein
MGITIHFEGKLRDQAAFDQLLESARMLAEDQQWPFGLIDEPEVTLQRVVNEKDQEEYVGPVKGLWLQPHENSEPFRLEFDADLFIQEYIKTQFAPIEIHQAVVEFLKSIEPLFDTFTVIDEGEFYESGDLEVLEGHIDRCFEMLDQHLEQPDKYEGPIRLENGRIVDLVTK